MASSAIVGACVPGVVPLALGRVHELVEDGAARKAAWSRCTAAFALGQAAAAYAFAYLFARTDGAYLTLFAAGAAAVLLALAIDLRTGRTRRV
jgi:predicted MFS family arabinose efflux permease